MSNQAIIDKASCIVQCALEYLEVGDGSRITMSKSDLSTIHSALVLASVMCRTNGKEG